MIERVEFRAIFDREPITGAKWYQSALEQLNDWLKGHSPVQIISICQVGMEDNPTIVLYFKWE